MNPKDEVKFEDIKKLVNASLEKFYKNDRDFHVNFISDF